MDKRYVSSKEKENLYNERNLFLLNIRELRDIGRKLGVVSPTTMKKEVLVDSILKIIYGEVKTEVRSAYGRPSVREFDINHYLEKIKKRSQLSPDDVDSVFKVASHEEKDLTNEVFFIISKLFRIFFENNCCVVSAKAERVRKCNINIHLNCFVWNVIQISNFWVLIV